MSTMSQDISDEPTNAFMKKTKNTLGSNNYLLVAKSMPICMA